MLYWLSSVCLTLLLFTVIPTIKKRDVVSSSSKLVSIIIPCRNEERNIARLLRSILAQKGVRIEVIVVNDQSEDRTALFARELGATVIDAPPLPNGWLGKSWACWNGAKHANGDILIFVDADTFFLRNGIPSLVQTYAESNHTLLTIHPYHYMQRFSERFAAFFHLITFASTSATHIWANQGHVKGGFGQCMIVSKQQYMNYGGHETIASEVLENLAFVQHVIENKGTVAATSGKDIIGMRMYNGTWNDIWNGFSKGFALGTTKTSLSLLLLIVLWIASLYNFLLHFTPYIGERPLTFLFGYSLLTIVFHVKLRDIGTFELFHTIVWPLFFIFFLANFLYSFIRIFIFRKTNWKGRTLLMTKRKNEM